MVCKVLADLATQTSGWPPEGSEEAASCYILLPSRGYSDFGPLECLSLPETEIAAGLEAEGRQ